MSSIAEGAPFLDDRKLSGKPLKKLKDLARKSSTPTEMRERWEDKQERVARERDRLATYGRETIKQGVQFPISIFKGERMKGSVK